MAGYTLLQYMDRLGSNKFLWGKKPDLLRTIDVDILMKTPPPVHRLIRRDRPAKYCVFTKDMTTTFLCHFVLRHGASY